MIYRVYDTTTGIHYETGDFDEILPEHQARCALLCAVEPEPGSFTGLQTVGEIFRYVDGLKICLYVG